VLSAPGWRECVRAAPSGARQSRKLWWWFGELSALVNQLCFLFSTHLGIIQLIIALSLGSQTDRELSEAKDSLGVGEEEDLTGIYPVEHMPVELYQ